MTKEEPDGDAPTPKDEPAEYFSTANHSNDSRPENSVMQNLSETSSVPNPTNTSGTSPEQQRRVESGDQTKTSAGTSGSYESYENDSSDLVQRPQPVIRPISHPAHNGSNLGSAARQSSLFVEVCAQLADDQSQMQTSEKVRENLTQVIRQAVVDSLSDPEVHDLILHKILINLDPAPDDFRKMPINGFAEHAESMANRCRDLYQPREQCREFTSSFEQLFRRYGEENMEHYVDEFFKYMQLRTGDADEVMNVDDVDDEEDNVPSAVRLSYSTSQNFTNQANDTTANQMMPTLQNQTSINSLEPQPHPTNPTQALHITTQNHHSQHLPAAPMSDQNMVTTIPPHNRATESAPNTPLSRPVHSMPYSPSARLVRNETVPEVGHNYNVGGMSRSAASTPFFDTNGVKTELPKLNIHRPMIPMSSKDSLLGSVSCKVCGAQFDGHRRSQLLKRHMIKKHPNDEMLLRGAYGKVWKCEICGVNCENQHAIDAHLRTHTKFKPFHCQYCRKAFAHKGSLNRHVKVCATMAGTFVRNGQLQVPMFSEQHAPPPEMLSQVLSAPAPSPIHQRPPMPQPHLPQPPLTQAQQLIQSQKMGGVPNNITTGSSSDLSPASAENVQTQHHHQHQRFATENALRLMMQGRAAALLQHQQRTMQLPPQFQNQLQHQLNQQSQQSQSPVVAAAAAQSVLNRISQVMKDKQHTVP